MYTLISTCRDARKLAALVATLAPKRSQEGYGTTDSQSTISLFQPELRHIFPGIWTYAICSVIWQNGTIPPHEDGNAATMGSKRFHLVIQSNDKAWTWHDGTWERLQEGGIYTMDPLKTHAAVNWGEEPRIHLVVDIKDQS